MGTKTRPKSNGKGGRPALPPDERLSETVHCRLTTAELDHVRVQASLAGLNSVSEFLRRRAMSYRIDPPPAFEGNPELLLPIDQLTRQIKAIGINYNQLLVSVHRGRNVSPSLDAIHDQLAAALEAATAALNSVAGKR